MVVIHGGGVQWLIKFLPRVALGFEPNPLKRLNVDDHRQPHRRLTIISPVPHSFSLSITPVEVEGWRWKMGLRC